MSADLTEAVVVAWDADPPPAAAAIPANETAPAKRPPPPAAAALPTSDTQLAASSNSNTKRPPAAGRLSALDLAAAARAAPKAGAAPKGDAHGAEPKGDAYGAAPKGDGHIVYDWLFVGAGISGVYYLGGLTPEERERALLIDQKDRVGGLWASIPRWQTVQNDPVDFCTDGFTTRKAVWTADDVCHMLEQRVIAQGLAPRMRLGHRLDAYEWAEAAGGGHWVCQVVRESDGSRAEVLAKRLVLCTGKHARPIIPDIPSDGSVTILHSSQVPDFSCVTGRRVAVVGGGASALDLVLNTIEAGAAGRVEWVVRTSRHFQGSGLLRGLWPMVLAQLLWAPAVANKLLNDAVNFVMLVAHALAGTRSWLPAARLDLTTSQVVPGRGALLRQKDRLARWEGAGVARAERGRVILDDGREIPDVDLLLLGTGYAPPARPAGFERPANFAGFLPTGSARGRLYMLGEDLLDTTAASPLVAALLVDALRGADAAWAGEPAAAAAAVGESVAAADADIETGGGGGAASIAAPGAAAMTKAGGAGAGDGAGAAGGVAELPEPGCFGAGFAPAARAAIAEGRRWPAPGRLVNAMEVATATAPISRSAKPFAIWRIKMLAVYLYYRFAHRTTVFDPARVIRTGMDLDKMPRAPLGAPGAPAAPPLA